MAMEMLPHKLLWVLLAGAALIALIFLALRFFSRQFLAGLGAQELRGNAAYVAVSPLLTRLARRAGVAEPSLLVINEISPNALCLRGGNGSIALTRGLLDALTREELEAVLAHCLAQIHLPRYRSSNWAAMMALPLSRFGDELPLGIGVLFQGFASILVRAFVRPERIFDADQMAAQLLENPDLVALSLRKLTSLTQKIPMAKADVALDHLFVVPSLRSDSLAPTLSTYPPAEERIRRLLAIPLSC